MSLPEMTAREYEGRELDRDAWHEYAKKFSAEVKPVNYLTANVNRLVGFMQYAMADLSMMHPAFLAVDTIRRLSKDGQWAIAHAIMAAGSDDADDLFREWCYEDIMAEGGY